MFVYIKYMYNTHMSNVSVGKKGENLAKKFLVKKGYVLLGERWQKRVGEIDIIAMDKSTSEIVFVEVKTRTSTKFGWPEEKVTRKKREKMHKTAQFYMLKHDYPDNQKWRMDVISIILRKTSKKVEISHFENIAISY